MTKYYCIKRAFAYLESEYGFHRYMKQVHGAYYYIAWTNEKKDIMVLYDDQTNVKIESLCGYEFLMPIRLALSMMM